MKRIRRIFPILAAGVWIVAADRLLAQPASDPAATQAAKSWVALIDGQHYAESWKQAATLFRQRVTASQWEEIVRSARDPLGKALSRKFVDAKFLRTIPGGPDGEYVVIHFETVYEHKQSAVETVTPMKEKDGAWRVAGYFIQ